jgi:hypothetical protein
MEHTKELSFLIIDDDRSLRIRLKCLLTKFAVKPPLLSLGSVKCIAQTISKRIAVEIVEAGLHGRDNRSYDNGNSGCTTGKAKLGSNKYG